MLENVLQETVTMVDQALAGGAPDFRPRETGFVTRINGSIAYVRGLAGVASESLLMFPGDILGIAADLNEREIGVILLGDAGQLKAGQEVRPADRPVDTPVGAALLGRVIDATGRILDDGPALETHEYWPVERDAPAIMARAPVSVPLQTGLKVVDALIPIGRGQRELIAGDRQTGKTALAVNAILNQRDTGVICIYCAIGQGSTAVARVIETFRRQGALAYTLVVVAGGEDPAGLQFITPYAATTMAEYFMQQGRDVLLVYDDLTRHARAYREISLLLQRPPGREAYPGDIFYIHSRLLERATHLSEAQGGGSITALPVIETQEQDISAYIPTNLISITDGQIFLSSSLFRKGQLPAVDVGKSVSRVGGKTQLPAYRKIAGDLRLSYAQFEELEIFARFGTRLDEATRATLERGRRVREVLKQHEYQTLSVHEQLIILYAATTGMLDSIAPEKIGELESALTANCKEWPDATRVKITRGEKLSDEEWRLFEQVTRGALSAWHNRQG